LHRELPSSLLYPCYRQGNKEDYHSSSTSVPSPISMAVFIIILYTFQITAFRLFIKQVFHFTFLWCETVSYHKREI
jgi:hypothetical protein